MKRRRLTIIGLLLVVIGLVIWLAGTESGLRWAFSHARTYLPGKLSVTSIQGRLIGSITLNGVTYEQSDTQINAEQIIIKWQMSALLASNIKIQHLYVRSLNVDIPTAVKADQPLILPEFTLPWRVELKNVQVDGINIKQHDQSLALKQIRVNASARLSTLKIEALSVKASHYKINVKGELSTAKQYRHKLDIQWQTRLPSGVLLKGKGQLTGDTDKTKIHQQISGPLQMNLDAHLHDLLNQFTWQAKVNVSKFDTSQLSTDWPSLTGSLKLDLKGDLTTATLTGNLNGNNPQLGKLDGSFALSRKKDDSIHLDYLKLHATDAGIRLDTHGQWMPGLKGNEFKLAMSWKNFRWPLHKPAWFISDSGNGSIQGNPDHYQLKLAGTNIWEKIGPITWQVSADGDLTGLNIHNLRVKALNGDTVAMGKIQWSPELSWNSKISAANINPVKLWPQWPGQLKSDLSVKGHMQKGQLIANADITSLSGKLRGYPVSLRSMLKWQNNNLNIDLFKLVSGNSKVNLNGQIGAVTKLSWDISSKNLTELLPTAKGQLHTQGKLSGPRDQLLLKTTFNGKGLKLSSYAVGNIDGAISTDLFKWQKVDIKLAAQAIKLNDHTLQSINIKANSQHMVAKVISNIFNAEVVLDGKTDGTGWKGHVTRADFYSNQYENWKLKNNVSLSINKKLIVVDSLCWHNNKVASLCASLKHEKLAWQSSIKINKFPLSPFSQWLHPDLKLEGVTDATAELQYQVPDQLLGKIDIDLPAGAINYPLLEGKRDRWEYRNGKINILLNQQGLNASTEFVLINGDKVQALISLPGAKLLKLDQHHQPIQASAKLNMHDTGLIEALVPETQDIKGSLAINLSVSGTLARPRITTHADLANGSLQIPRLGLTIKQLSVKANSDNLDKINFRLDAKSGDGNLTVEGQTTLDQVAGWPTTISVKGKQLQVSNIPEAQVQISPDLIIKLKKHNIEINGAIHIPYAKLQPKDVTTAARVSGDAVIISDQQPVQQKWSILSRIRLTLGDKVSFYGFGFEGRLGGNLLLEDEPGQLTKATGEINIPEGRYRAYGQNLVVEHGRLLFTGSPLTNPGLDLRAIRRVNEVTAGLKVSGSLNKPKLELFSIPAMGQTNALSYLILGRPIEHASGDDGAMMSKAALALGFSGGDRLARILGKKFGFDEMRVESGDNGNQASLVMGRYLSPRLYVSYGVGLIETINTLSLRYQISDKWQIKTESGEYQGADIIYTIKR